jgi:hypothetical protein
MQAQALAVFDPLSAHSREADGCFTGADVGSGGR